MSTKIIKILTPKRLLLNGLLIDNQRSKILFIFVHGLSGNLFSRSELANHLVNSGAAALVFNNRGYGIINKFRQFRPRSEKKYQVKIFGQAHEVFSDCLDDLDGAINFGVRAGYKKIILVGRSTGCNKIAYYLSQKSPTVIKGAVLLAPVSDYSIVRRDFPTTKLKRVVGYAQHLVKAGRAHELLPTKIWPEIIDAQRFLSLYTPESLEEIFSYAVPTKKPTILQKIKKPLLICLAAEDEFGDRSAEKIAAWFKSALVKQSGELKIISGANHSFSKQAVKLQKIIAVWISKLKNF